MPEEKSRGGSRERFDASVKAGAARRKAARSEFESGMEKTRKELVRHSKSIKWLTPIKD